MSPKKEKNLLDNIKEDVAKSGFPLEIEVTFLLKNHPQKWSVENQFLYIDEEWESYEELVGIPRTVDIVASRHYSHPKYFRQGKPVYHIYFSMYLVIECKKSSKPWLFFIKENSIIDKVFLAMRRVKFLITTPYEDVARPSSSLKFLTRSHYFDFQKEAIISYEPFTGGRGRRIIEGTDQVIKALEYLRRIYIEKDSDSLKVFYPVIVFDGDMFESWLEDGKLQYREIDYAQYIVKKPTKGYVEYNTKKGTEIYVVDVLKKSFLKEYLKILDEEIAKMSEEFAKAFPPIKPNTNPANKG